MEWMRGFQKTDDVDGAALTALSDKILRALNPNKVALAALPAKMQRSLSTASFSASGPKALPEEYGTVLFPWIPVPLDGGVPVYPVAMPAQAPPVTSEPDFRWALGAILPLTAEEARLAPQAMHTIARAFQAEFKDMQIGELPRPEAMERPGKDGNFRVAFGLPLGSPQTPEIAFENIVARHEGALIRRMRKFAMDAAAATAERKR
jgi:hypothetical protein